MPDTPRTTDLSADERREIAERYAKGETTTQLARAYGTSKPTILRTVRRQEGTIRPIGRPLIYDRPLLNRNVKFPADVLSAAMEYGKQIGAEGTVAPGLRYFACRGMEAWRKEQDDREAEVPPDGDARS